MLFPIHSLSSSSLSSLSRTEQRPKMVIFHATISDGKYFDVTYGLAFARSAMQSYHHGRVLHM